MLKFNLGLLAGLKGIQLFVQSGNLLLTVAFEAGWSESGQSSGYSEMAHKKGNCVSGRTSRLMQTEVC